MRLREELRTGELTLAQFAADLHEVAQRAASRPLYEDPARFFALTYPTHAMRELVAEVAERLRGRSDKAVRQLELTYGGGKTHTLITLHHLFRDPAALPALPAVREFQEAVGGELPRAFVVSLCFDKIDVEKGIEDVPGPGGSRRTLRHPWSVLAYQLAGDAGLELIHADGLAEERETPPAEPLLVKLLRIPQQSGLGTLLLTDEVLMYARQKAGMSPVWRNRIQDFFQYLVQAVAKVDRATIVASLLATDPATQKDAQGKLLMGDLAQVFRRQQERAIQPVSKDEVGEVLRRRLFVPDQLGNPDSYRHHVIAAVRELGKLDPDVKKGAKGEHDRFLASYPFHPDFLDVFYSRWTQLEGFQRTRGILRTLAIGLQEAVGWDDSPVIGPAVLLAGPETPDVSRALAELASVARSEQVQQRQTAWKQLLEKELELARRAQREETALARHREVEQAVVAVFLHSQPIGHKAGTRELIRLLGTGSPDRIGLTKGLQRWRDLSWFLDDEDGVADSGGDVPKSWRLGNRPNLRQMHDEALRQRVGPDLVAERLDKAIRKTRQLTAGAKAAGAVVHTLPHGPADVKDDVQFRFAVLGPEAASESGKPSALAKRFLDETTGSHKPRVHRNAVVLAVPSRDGLGAARSAVRELLGWEEVSSELEASGHELDLGRRHRLQANLKSAAARVPDAVRQAYGIVVTTNTENQVHAFRLPAEGGALFPQIGADTRTRIQTKRLEPAALRPGEPNSLWRPGETSRRMVELADAFARLPKLPKLLRPEVVRDTVLDGVEKGLFVARLTRPDKTFRTWWRDRVDPDAATSPDLEIVLPEKAELSGLDATMLSPEGVRLPELWKEGPLPVADVLRYFKGGTSAFVTDYDEVTVPRCDPFEVRAAVAEAVESGLIWLVNQPTSLWKEPCPESALDGAAALRPSPDLIPAADLLPEALPAAWSGGATNAFDLAQAASQAHREPIPWGLVRESIRRAVDTRWLEIVRGEVDCRYSDAGQLHLKSPAPKSEPVQDPSPHPAPGNGGGVLLEMHEIQDLGDLTSDLLKLTAGQDFRFRVSPELGGPLEAKILRQINERLARISEDLRVASP